MPVTVYVVPVGLLLVLIVTDNPVGLNLSPCVYDILVGAVIVASVNASATTVPVNPVGHLNS